MNTYTVACPELERRNNNGNTATKVDASGATTYAWNYDNQLTSVTLPGSGGTVTFRYDPFGRRIQKVSPAGTTNYLYDGANVIEEVDGTGAVLARYSQGPGIDQPLSDVVGGVPKFYEADGLGSITSLADISGSLTDTYTTDTFGRTTASSGTTRNPFRYTARDLDSETGLMYYRARYYDAASGRFVSEDPVGFNAALNFYPYTYNNPTDFTDPSGKNPVVLPALPILVIGGGLVVGYYVLTRPSVQEGLQQATQAIGSTITNFFSRPRGKSDPIPWPGNVNPGPCNDKNKCKPCPPDSPYWEQAGNVHGSTTGVHYHWWTWNQKPYPDCTCYPARMDTGTPPPGGTSWTPGGPSWP